MSDFRSAPTVKKILTTVIVICWLLAVMICYLHRDIFTAESIVSMSPENLILSIMLVLGVFALKSISVIIYCGVVYAACGILFPLPVSIPVSIAGTVVMVTLPYLLGKFIGSNLAGRIEKKYPEIQKLLTGQRNNNFTVNLIIRLTGLLPSDPYSAYMGATRAAYLPYMLASVIGMMPDAILYTVMGSSVMDPTSPRFLITLGIRIVVSAVTAVFAYIRKRRRAESTCLK